MKAEWRKPRGATRWHLFPGGISECDGWERRPDDAIRNPLDEPTEGERCKRCYRAALLRVVAWLQRDED